MEAYVLLAEPGGGKSEAFKREAASASYILARDFVNAGPPERWSGEALFIDGFDQMRAGSESRNTPLDQIVQKLDAVGRPRFRICCREADWLSADQSALRAVSRGDVGVLHLDPLTDEEVLLLLRRRGDRVPDAQAFVNRAERQSLDAMLRNPLLLNLLVDAVGGDEWPASREDIYARACLHMATEHDEAIDAAERYRRASIDPAKVLDAAGWVSAVLLLSGNDIVLTGPPPSECRPGETAIASLLGGRDGRSVEAALASKLFVAVGPRREFRHRSIAEYLASKTVGGLIQEHKLPLQRVLALMQPPDGGIVEPLRGLFGWLGTHSPDLRPLLIDRDPLALVLYGDVRGYSVEDKQRLFESFRREADEFVWFRRGNWAAHPFGALGTADMATTLAGIVASADRRPEHQSVVDCVLDAVVHGEPMPSLLGRLELVVLDSSFRDDVRTAALEAWLKQPGCNLQRAKQWLYSIRAGSIDDTRDELCAHLLAALYPNELSATEVVAFLRPTKADHYIGWYRHFWSTLFFQRTRKAQFGQVADSLVARSTNPKQLRESFDEKRLVGRVIVAALQAEGSEAPVDRVAGWLRLGVDEHGSACIDGDGAKAICGWLSLQPEVMKRITARQMALVEPDPTSGAFHYWTCDGLLYGAERPRDWYRWLLQHAADADAEPQVEHCIFEAAMAAMRSDPAFDITMENVEDWISAHRDRWPQAEHWVRRPATEEPWWSPWYWSINDQRGKQHRRQVRDEAKRRRERERRRAGIAPHLNAVVRGAAPPELMQWLALVHEDHVADHRGDTPQERIASFLGGDIVEARHAIEGLMRTLERSDLPNVDDVLRSDLDRKPYCVASACLLGAKLTYEHDPRAPERWSDELVRCLVAFYLTDGTQDAGWYTELAQQRPRLVADVMLAYVRQCLRLRSAHSIHGLWRLAREDALRDLARFVIPTVLQEFPQRARLSQVRHLNTELLPAALKHLPLEDLRALISQRLQCDQLDSAQRMAWLLGGLRFASHRRSRELVALARTSAVRRRRLVDTLQAQTDHAMPLPDMPAAACGRFVELFAPMTRPDFPFEAAWVGRDHHRREFVQGMLNRLATSTRADAREEIERLRDLPDLAAWWAALDAARFDQIRAARAARFEHGAVTHVAQTLLGAAPANSLDLAALTIQLLAEIESRIRGAEANDLDLFWRDPVNGQRKPRIENQCRDRLLGLLGPKLLARGVVLNKESMHAGDKRADLRAEIVVGDRRRVVPIEIKSEGHAQVWTAWRDQLDGLYVTHPDAEGVGIYLVLWFGHRPKSSGQGQVAPRTAHELQSQLRLLIPATDSVRLSVCVLDLSKRVASGSERRKVRRRR